MSLISAGSISLDSTFNHSHHLSSSYYPYPSSSQLISAIHRASLTTPTIFRAPTTRTHNTRSLFQPSLEFNLVNINSSHPESIFPPPSQGSLQLLLIFRALVLKALKTASHLSKLGIYAPRTWNFFSVAYKLISITIQYPSLHFELHSTYGPRNNHGAPSHPPSCTRALLRTSSVTLFRRPSHHPYSCFPPQSSFPSSFELLHTILRAPCPHAKSSMTS